MGTTTNAQGINYAGIGKLVAAMETYIGKLKKHKAKLEEIKNSKIHKAIRGDKTIEDLKKFFEKIDATINGYEMDIHNYREELGKLRVAYSSQDNQATSSYTAALNGFDDTFDDSTSYVTDSYDINNAQGDIAWKKSYKYDANPTEEKQKTSSGDEE